MIKKFLNRLFGKNKSINRKDRDSRRSFTKTQRVRIWQRQEGKCNVCYKKLDLRTVVYDHIIRWADGGKTIFNNGQALCPACNTLKNFEESAELAETRRSTLND